MVDYLIPILLIVVVARLGRFFAAPNHRGSGIRCYDVGREADYSGVYCMRLKGHWGLHRTAQMGALRWYKEWETNKRTRTIGL